MIALARAGLVSVALHAPLALLPGPGAKIAPSPEAQALVPVSLLQTVSLRPAITPEPPIAKPKPPKPTPKMAPQALPAVSEGLEVALPIEQGEQPSENEPESEPEALAEALDVEPPTEILADGNENQDSEAQARESVVVDVVAFDMAQYIQDMVASIERHKRYPRAALMMGLEGRVVVLAFIDSGGRKVGAPKVVQSSGAPLLDEEALRMVQVAHFPAPEQALPQNPLPLHIPVSFSVR